VGNHLTILQSLLKQIKIGSEEMERKVFTAKNGRPYIKDESGKVRFISNAEAEKYLMQDESDKRGKYFIVAVFVVLATIIAASEHGLGLL